MLHRDGSIRWFLARGSVTRNAQGAAVRMAGTDTDITERKRGEEALRQAEEINKRIVENTSDCVKILDLDGRLVYMNREGLRFLEIEDASLVLNRPIVELLRGGGSSGGGGGRGEARTRRRVAASRACCGRRQVWRSGGTSS